MKNREWVRGMTDEELADFLMGFADGDDRLHYQNLRQGLSEGEALHQADIFAAGVMADRSKGSMPTLFESTNPVFKMFTQFQLEVNNQFSEVFKDLPREAREKGLGALALTLLQYFLGALMFNDLYEYFIGRRPALDPIGMLNGFVGDATGYQLPNLIEMWEGGITAEDFKTERLGVGDAVSNLTTEALGNLPFSAGLTLFGIETDGGRIPASSAVPDLSALWDAASEKDWSAEKRWKEVKDELWKLSYILPPFGGNQAQKVWKGLEAYFKGGSYTVDKDGNDILQYPVFHDEGFGRFWTPIQAALFGKSSLDEAQDWVDAGFNSLGAKQTAVYQDLLDADVDDRDAWELIRALSDARKTEDESQAEIQRRILEDSHISGDGKAIAYYGLLASESERELMDQLEGMRIEPGDIYETVVGLRADGLRAGGKAELLAETDLPEEAKRLVFFEKVTESREDEIESILVSGVTFDEFLEAYAKHGEIDGMEMNASGKAAAFAYWVDSRGFTEEQAAVIKDQLAFFTIMPASASRYEKLTDSGMDPADAYALSTELGELEPEEGEDQVADVQRWRTCVDFSDDPAVQMSALMGVMSESQFAKCQVASNMDLDPDAYVGYYEIRDRFDTDGNGSFKSAEVKAAIDSMSGYGLTDAQKAVLWQIQNKSWSWKNNPYDTTVGREVWQILNPGK